MLSKMGWSPGKGLGINEDGVKEHIKPSLKQDNLGIGATKKTIDNWLDNSSAFEELLKGLNEEQGGNEIDEKRRKDSEQESSSDEEIRINKVKSKKKNKKSSSSTYLSNNDSMANTSDSGSLSSIRLA